MGVVRSIILQVKKRPRLEKSAAPPGIKTDYERVLVVGTGGTIDEKGAAEILSAEITPRFQESNMAVQRSLQYLQESRVGSDFLRIYAAFHEAACVYPITSRNRHSGERIPLVHAEEVATDAVVLAFQAHYKSAYQRLREVLEMVLLQLYFAKVEDKSMIGKWGRQEVKTPALNIMLDEIAKDALYQSGDGKLKITNKLRRIYRDLGAYTHTRGVPTLNMGLMGSNILAFTADALDRFFVLFASGCRLCIACIAIFFPQAIIEVPAFAKFGHLDPVWLPRSDEVKCIRSVLSATELNVLEDLAASNVWFQTVCAKVNSLPDLSPAEIEETYEFVVNSAPEAVDDALNRINELLE
ncbi:hypothetical protein DRH29_04645 [candidate division Kazan bacterium]|uniref:Uncharacterized protein n=1 Tax=candidate division Kazan bacterium TaxID=2202143 RepID=A0A420ZBN0_UNCK3|nr:MAG: hypothetical protein DRH29_04645 [candidate division Kazan bacterium]